MYFLAQRWTGNRLAASVAGMVFAFNGLTWHSLMLAQRYRGTGLDALGGADRGTCICGAAKGGRRVAIAALVGAMQMLTGVPEIIFRR